MEDTYQTTTSDDVNDHSEPPLDSIDFGDVERQPLTTKNAVEFLLNGTLRNTVCRYCLNVTSQLLELDKVLQIGGKRALYQISIRDMIAHFHPFQASQDSDLPNKICELCLDRTLQAYLFTQQCEQSERALNNCLEDISERVDKLDPLERKSKRGRQKINPNHNKIYVAYENVMDYAEPITHLVNQGSALVIPERTGKSNDLTCLKCWEVLPNMESLLNHEKIHPKSMWYHCRQCGRSFAKHLHLKKHIKSFHSQEDVPITNNQGFECKTCGDSLENPHKYLQHIEKHKFKKVLKHVLLEKTNELCTICLNKEPMMVDLETRMALSGSCPELNGDKSLYQIIGSTLPDMNYFYSYMGTKICQSCSDRAISTYIFINQTLHTRRRLDDCIATMLNTLAKIEEPTKSILIELSDTLVVPITDLELTVEDIYDDDFDETQLKVEVLEDKYRIPPSSESEDEKPVEDFQRLKNEKVESDETVSHAILDNPAKRCIKTYSNKQLNNGFRTNRNKCFDGVSEFLTFKKKEKPKKVTKITRHRCDLCSKSFISVYFLKKHLMRHINRTVECTNCKILFKSKFLLHEHNKMVHLLNESSYNSCRICERTFADMEKMKRHQKSHNRRQCSLCDKLFRTQKDYNSHLQRHVAKYTLSKRKVTETCSFCESECLSKNKLSIHVNKDHLQIKPYPCDMCEHKFYTKYNLANHKKIHGMKSNEKCEFCGATLKCRRDLVIHVRKHMGLKPDSCLVCSEAFYSQSERDTHMTKIHGGRLICNICKIIFADKSELKFHNTTVHLSQFY